MSVGDHMISLLVIDGVEGHDVLLYVNITVAPEPSTVTGGGEFPWYLWVVIALLVAGTALVVMRALKGRGQRWTYCSCTPTANLRSGKHARAR